MFTYENKYRYIGKHGESDNKDLYRFDQEKANKLAANKQYLELADYLSQYQFIDAEKDAEQNNRIIQLRDLGNKTQAYYKRIPEEERNVIDFANVIFTPGGLKQLRTQTVNDAAGNPVSKYSTEKEFKDDNPVAADYIDGLKTLGSSSEREATALKLVFSDKKYGFLGIDKLKKDYNEYYDVLSKSGLTEKEIESLGGRISKKDGNITLEFDKNAGCCTRILNALQTGGRLKNKVQIIGLDAAGEIKSTNLPEYANPYNSTDAYGNYVGFTQQQRDLMIVNHLQELVGNSRTKAESIEINHNLEDKVYSSSVFEIQTDRTDILDELYNGGQISWQEYNARIKEEKGVNIPSRLKALNYGDYEIYTDYYNEDKDSEIRQPLKPENWDDFRNILKGVPATKIHFLGETSGGRVGLHISIDPDALYKHKGKEGNGRYTDKPIQIFIPGFCTEEIEEQMNNDTGLRAIKEWNNMMDYGYNHKNVDGTQIGVDENGTVYRYIGDQTYIDNSSNAKENAIREINEDIIKEEASRLKYRFMNNKGEIDMTGYSLAAKKASIQSIDELYSGIPFEDLEGNPLIERLDMTAIDKLFDPELRQRVYLHPEEFNYKVLEKLRHLYDLYDYISIDLIRGNNVYAKPQE